MRIENQLLYNGKTEKVPFLLQKTAWYDKKIRRKKERNFSNLSFFFLLILSDYVIIVVQ